MFHYEAFKNMSLGKSGDCTRLILRDDSGEIIFAALELTDEHYVAGKKGDEGFEQFIKSFIVADVKQPDTNQVCPSTESD